MTRARSRSGVAVGRDFIATPGGLTLQSLYLETMTWSERLAPSLDDFAAEEVLDGLNIEDAFELTGLYQGVDLGRRSVLDYGTEPSRVFLYRRPILDEWAERGDVSLGDLIAHVLVHEIGHHFGLSDDDIHRIEDEA